MLYEIKCWTIINPHENKVSVAEMKMLSWICGKTKHCEIRNDNIIEYWDNTYNRKDDRK